MEYPKVTHTVLLSQNKLCMSHKSRKISGEDKVVNMFSA